jgi:hypothetical protein
MPLQIHHRAHSLENILKRPITHLIDTCESEECYMRITIRAIWAAALFSLLAIMTPNHAAAQITGHIDATLKHSFIVSTKTLPPGQYTFRMEQGTDGNVLIVSSANGKDSDQAVVRQSEASSTPAHTELIFRRYGNKEFLNKIYEGGNKEGIVVADLSGEEKELQAQGQKPTEHSEPAHSKAAGQ